MAARQLPDDIAEGLRANPQAGRAFESLPAEAQSDWVRWVGRARTRRGRDRRIGEMVRRLGAYAPAGAAEETVVEQPPPPPPREWWPWLLVLLLLVLGGLLAWWLVARNDNQVNVPRVVGLRLPEARVRLHNRHLIESVTRLASTRPRGTVLVQRPRAGTNVEKGAIVNLVVSNAPALVAVPDVVGLDADKAEQRLVALKLVPDERSAFSQKPRGTVISQDPAASTRVRQGSRVVLTVSHGRGKVAVPAVVGQTVQNATKALRKADLVPNVVQVPSDQPAGTVVAQDPQPGETVVRGSKVRINVSKGGAATTQTTTTAATTTTATTTAAPPGTATVPNLVGEAFGPALRRLEASKLRSTVVYARSTQPRGTVTAQRPAAGSKLAPGSRVRVTVSAGPSPSMQSVPDVVGDDQNTAASTLRQAGFTPVVIRRTFAGSSQEGVVLEQQPGADLQAPRGGSVAIYVGASG